MRLSELLEPGVSYFGMELWMSPRSAEFRQSCIRTPDIICQIIGGRHSVDWLVLWKNWENGVSRFGAVEREGDYYPVESVPGCSMMPPLSVVLQCLAEQRICTERFVGVIAAEPLPSAERADVRWDVPIANLSFLQQSNTHGTQLRLYTPEQLDAYYSSCSLKRQSLLRIPPTQVVHWARIFLARASHIASRIVASEADYRFLNQAYREAKLYSGLLMCCVPRGADLDELVARARKVEQLVSNAYR